MFFYHLNYIIMSVNVTGLYSNGGVSVGLTNIDAETVKINQVLTSESSSTLLGNTLVYGDLEVIDENIINKINVLDSSTTSNFLAINDNIKDISDNIGTIEASIDTIGNHILGYLIILIQKYKDKKTTQIKRLNS